jgi:protease I
MRRYVSLFIVLIMLLSSTVVFAQNQQKKEGKLKGKRIVMIIAARMFDSNEFKEPKDIFEQEGAKITVASSTLSESSGSGLYGLIVVKPDILITDIETKNFDAIVFVGGLGCMEYFDSPIAHKVAKQALEQGKIVAAICGAPVILANAGLLNGKKATTSRSYNIKEKGALYTGNPVERDGNIITANGPSASTEFGEAIASALSE